MGGKISIVLVMRCSNHEYSRLWHPPSRTGLCSLFAYGADSIATRHYAGRGSSRCARGALPRWRPGDATADCTPHLSTGRTPTSRILSLHALLAGMASATICLAREAAFPLYGPATIHTNGTTFNPLNRVEKGHWLPLPPQRGSRHTKSSCIKWKYTSHTCTSGDNTDR